ncbi:putative enoyl-CoA hydratase, mitochondrial [Colletotrichum spaethianum]|uniref:Enoyl-CoA hydratase, mitochondrial n=1 Tax=Colletotrichum spaethianum TaxID=700344 RepID=A0AA37L7U9_9PEZI|nr:putative enoyl-CoA hydratase, mitochondrial [Colletotrichum spaethianum]GKT43631.1 putative enoyl-CoA hydratase, mitochondrial [Colletotrichum spaethianum]
MTPPIFWISALVGSLVSTTFALTLPEYRGLKTAQNGSVLEVTLHNPTSEINLWGQDFQDGLTDMVQRLQTDNETKVVIFKSDVPRFFCAHVDLLIPDIRAVEGRARGAGNEFLLALDMRFATKKETQFGQIEVATGLVPGGGGGQMLSQIIGRGLAMEYVLSGKDINAKDAEKIGWINKAFDHSADMYAHIDDLTSRYRLFPRGALVAAKKSINLWARPPQDNFLRDAAAFSGRLADPVVMQLVGRALSLTQNLSLGDVELNLGRDLPLLYT